MYKDKLESLIAKSSDDVALTLISDAIAGCGKYVNAVVRSEAAKSIFGIGSEQYHEADRKRSETHDGAVLGLKILDRIYQQRIGKALFPGLDDMGRAEIADKFIKPITDEFFNDRIK